MSESVQRLTASAATRAAPDPEAMAMIEARFGEINTAGVRALEQGNAVYEELSRQNLSPRTNLDAITSPFTVSTRRALTLRTTALYGLLTLMVSLLLVPLAYLIHHYFRREILPARPRREPVVQRGEDEEARVERDVEVESRESVVGSR